MPETGAPAAQEALGGVADGTGVGERPAAAATGREDARAETTPTATTALMLTCLSPGVARNQSSVAGRSRGGCDGTGHGDGSRWPTELV